jgi:uncharacterized membrane protein YfcA
MELELNLLSSILLAIAGVTAGFVNTLAGGGAMITVPLMIILGVPADVANGSNRLAVLTQSLTAVGQFKKHNVFKGIDLIPILVPTIFGTLLGALMISYVPVQMVKMVLLSTMIFISLIILFFPESIFAKDGEQALAMSDKPLGVFWMFLAGFYGGAIQAGVGFVLIAILGAVLRYDLVRGNAIKMVCTSLFGGLAFLVFYFRGQVWWQPAIILAVSSMVGVVLSVNFAIKVEQKTLKKILLSMVVLACVSAMFS